MIQPPVIDHDPHEKRLTRRYWLPILAILVVGWIGSWFMGMLQWHSLALGAMTGMALATYAIEVSGNKVPGSGSDKSRRP